MSSRPQDKWIAIVLLVIFLSASTLCDTQATTAHKTVLYRSEYKQSPDPKIRTTANAKRYKVFEITAYDLSVESCGKLTTSRGYGVTRTGKSLKGKSWKIRAIAVDPKVIKLGSKVRITFSGWREKYNGIYTAIDTGGAIKGNKIDLFLGENSYQECLKFGRVKAKLEVLK